MQKTEKTNHEERLGQNDQAGLKKVLDKENKQVIAKILAHQIEQMISNQRHVAF